MTIAVRPVGESALLLETEPARVHAVREAVVRAGLHGVVEVVPGARTVLVGFDANTCDPAAVAPELVRLAESAGESVSVRREVTIDVRYDGTDLADVASLTGLSEKQVVERHAGVTYTVAFLGFAPGFPYLDGLDPVLHLPRLDSPRQRVPSGSVAIAGSQTCIYSAATPGGWRLLGRTDARLFDVDAEPPALLTPGTQVCFRPC